MGRMKELYMKLQEGDDLTEVESAYIRQSIIDQELDESYLQFIEDNKD